MARPKAALISLLLLAMAVLLMEICLARIFSVISWHHFAYLIISLALLGFGAAGIYLTVSRRFSDPARDDRADLGLFAWLFSLTSVAAIVLVSRIRFCPDDIALMGDYSNLVSLLLIYGAVGVPFFFAGVCIGRLVALAGDRVGPSSSGRGASDARWPSASRSAAPARARTSAAADMDAARRRGRIPWKRTA